MRPTLKELQQRISQDLQAAEFPQSFAAHLGNSMAGTFHMLYSHTELALAKLLPDTATGEALERWGKIWNVYRRPATAAQGVVVVEAHGPIILPAGVRLSSGECEYELTQALECTTSRRLEVGICAVDLGNKGNTPGGTKLRFVEAHSGLAAEALVIALDGGTDAETDESLRGRVLFAIQNPPQGGAVIDYLNWIGSVPGVSRAFVKTAIQERPGVVGYSFITATGTL